MFETWFSHYKTIRLFGKKEQRTHYWQTCVEMIKPQFLAFRRWEITLSEYEEFLKSINFIY